MTSILKIAKGIMPKGVKNSLNKVRRFLAKRWMPEYSRYAYSQEGEDLVIAKLLDLGGAKRLGFYVDIGAHHPKRFSNTQYFYERGWSGLNVDASEAAMQEFAVHRKRDVNITSGVGEKEGMMTYHEFNSSALNSFDAKLAEARNAESPFKIIGKKVVPVRTLKSILAEYVPTDTTIDFMSVDVEGLDLEVLRSNDWELFRPLLLLVEDGPSKSIQEAQQGVIAEFMNSQHYELISKTDLTLFFADKKRAALP